MINRIKAFFKRAWEGMVVNLAVKSLLFVFLVTVMFWLGINILHVGGGQGLVAAGPLDGAALPASAATPSVKPSPLPAEPIVQENGSKQAEKRDVPQPQLRAKPAQGATGAGEKPAVPEQDVQSEKAPKATDKQSSGNANALPPSFEQMTVLAALCGALGATLHALGSLVAFVGNGRFVNSWSLWYFAQPIRGGVLACGVYWASYGDLLSPTAASEAGAGTLGLMFMVGLFSDPALEKLREVFMVLFRTGTKARADPLESGRKPVIAKARVVPSAGGASKVEIDGEGFEAGDEVTINGNKQKILSQTAKTLAVELPAQLAVQGSKLELVVRPTEKGASASASSTITVS